MTQRKPPGASFESWVDAHIRAARERGDFDDLPGQGRPLQGLDDADDPAWWAKQLLRRERLSVLPPALEIRRRVAAFREGLGKLPSEARVRSEVAALNDEICRLNRLAAGGPPTTQAPLDVDACVARWRTERRTEQPQDA